MKPTKVDSKNESTLVIQGFLYYENYCWDDCCEHYEGYCVASRQAESEELEHCQCENCEKEQTQLVSKHGNPRFERSLIDDGIFYMIKAALGYSPQNGEYIEVTLHCSAKTPDSILLGHI